MKCRFPIRPKHVREAANYFVAVAGLSRRAAGRLVTRMIALQCAARMCNSPILVCSVSGIVALMRKKPRQSSLLCVDEYMLGWDDHVISENYPPVR
jgi:hypothetical protein